MKIPSYDDLGKNRKKDDKEKKHKYRELHPFFPDVSRVLIAGPSGSGKTVALTHMLLSPLIYFEEIILYSRTPDQPKYVEIEHIFNDIAKKAKIPSFFTIKNGDVEDVEKLSKGIFRICIFDDYICEKKQMNTIVKYWILGRHYGVSPVFLSQSYYATPKDIRINTSKFILFNVGTKREIKSILADHQNLTEQQYKDNTQNHDCLCIDKIGKKIFKNFDENLN